MFAKGRRVWGMSVENLHPQYEQFLQKWIRARDVLAGEDSIKAAGTRYLPRLDSQTDDEYASYVARAAFFNGSARTADGFSGMIFRRDPVVRLPDSGSKFKVQGSKEQGKSQNKNVGKSGVVPPHSEIFAKFEEDVDLLGASLYLFAKRLTTEILSVGRAGTLIEWNDAENRAFLAMYTAEQIINWRMTRVNGRSVLGLVVLRETADDAQ
jgi:hypothetical protein